MASGLYIGSFDMFTNGHLDIVEQAVDLFDRIYVVIGVNPKKRRTFTLESSEEFIKKALEGRPYESKVMVDTWSGLAVEYAEAAGIQYLVRGLRNSSDYATEENLAIVNRELSSNIRTVYLYTNFPHISSSMVKELMDHKYDVGKYVPADIQLLEKCTGN